MLLALCETDLPGRRACDIDAVSVEKGVYTSLRNHHSGGAEKMVSLQWSRDNASCAGSPAIHRFLDRQSGIRPRRVPKARHTHVIGEAPPANKRWKIIMLEAKHKMAKKATRRKDPAWGVFLIIFLILFFVLPPLIVFDYSFSCTWRCLRKWLSLIAYISFFLWLILRIAFQTWHYRK